MKRCLLDLFCGAGGLSSGLKSAGFKAAAGIDADYNSIRTFKFNFPEAVALTKNLAKYTPQDFSNEYGFKKGDFTIIVGGPPCQGFSISGQRRLDDPRNKLFLELIKYVEFFSPEAFIVENVPGLIGLYEGKIRVRIAEALEVLGYDIFYKTLLASDYGIPQDRRRVFFVGVQKGKKFHFPQKTHSEKSEHPLCTKITVADAISDLPLLDSQLGAEEMDYLYGPLNSYQEYCRKGSERVYNHTASKHAQKTREIIALVPEGSNYKSLPIELQNTRRFHVAWTRIDSSKPAPTVDTGHRHHFHPWVNRVPTVRENARFQSFPDTFMFLGPKTSQYKQVGNAVPPLLAMAVGKELIV
jgi:DNA (cytosine-5)-methyltransferase 1